MARVCGIELSSSDAILAVVDQEGRRGHLVDIQPPKIKLGNDELSENIRSFYNAYVNFVHDNHIDVVVIKSRPKKGKMAGGAVSFKLEALIQLDDVNVKFVSGQAIAAAHRREPFEYPDGLPKYQEPAFKAACLYIRQNC